MIEHRYEERVDEFILRSWPDSGGEHSLRGLVATRPEWLANVVHVAVVAGAAQRVAVPPPDLIVWFTTNDELGLAELCYDLAPAQLAYQHELQLQNT